MVSYTVDFLADRTIFGQIAMRDSNLRERKSDVFYCEKSFFKTS